MIEKALQDFVVTCSCKSIAEAAEKLFVSRQALSLMIRRFENDVGVQLFVRSKKGIVLTSTGKVFYQRCKKILDEYRAAVDEARVMYSSEKLSIRVAFSLTALRILLASRIIEFEQICSRVTVEFNSMPSTEAWERLHLGELDFVCSIRPPERYDFAVEKIKHGFPILLVKSGTKLSKKNRATLQDLEYQTLLNSKEMTQFFTDASLRKLNIKYKPFTNDPTLISEAIVGGHGVYITAMDSIDTFNMRGITAVPFYEEALDLNLYATYRKDRELSDTEHKFIEYLKDIGKQC